MDLLTFPWVVRPLKSTFLAQVQKTLGLLAHVLESIGNVFNFSVPFISWMALLIFTVVTLLLYYVNLRYIIIGWGMNKFSKKLLRPNAINNNELVDFISRVPDNEEMVRETIIPQIKAN